MENLDKREEKLLLRQLLSHCSPARWITAGITVSNNMSRCTDLCDSDFLWHCVPAFESEYLVCDTEREESVWPCLFSGDLTVKWQGAIVLSRMSQATDDMSGWLNKDTFLSNVRLMPSRSKPAITLSQGERQFACWNLCVFWAYAGSKIGCNSEVITGFNNPVNKRNM